MEISSKFLKTNQDSNCTEVFLSGQIWNPIPSLKETAVVRFELLQAKKETLFFFWIAHFTSFSLFYNLVALEELELARNVREGLSFPYKYFPHVTSFVQLVGKLRRCDTFLNFSVCFLGRLWNSWVDIKGHEANKMH